MVAVPDQAGSPRARRLPVASTPRGNRAASPRTTNAALATEAGPEPPGGQSPPCRWGIPSIARSRTESDVGDAARGHRAGPATLAVVEPRADSPSASGVAGVLADVTAGLPGHEERPGQQRMAEMVAE